MNYILEFEIHELPKPINAQTSFHWRKKGQIVKEWHKKVHYACLYHRPKFPLVRAQLRLTRFSSRCPDYDGLVSSWKHVIDGLVICGILSDDTMDVIGMPVFLWEKYKPKQGKIHVRVEEIHS
jgi:hypothetical protein